MTVVARRVRDVTKSSESPVEEPPEDLPRYRDHHAWALLGEPGAGKTTTFEEEAKATDGVCVRVADFIDADVNEDWRGKTLFLDGLDEVRASGVSGSTLTRVAHNLKRLGSPRFRIACRAADWNGASDRGDLESAAVDRQIIVLQIEPLGEDDILTLLRDNHGVADPEVFVGEAKRRRMAGLLDNPQTLDLLARAIRNQRWPTSRDDTYRLACETLAVESNKRHRDASRLRPRSVEEILDAAGRLCAVLLLSDQTGIALDRERTGSCFIALEDCKPPELEAATWAVRSKLFRAEGEERLVPSHRSVAEYLAARWLAQQVDANGLPLGRLLNLLVGPDGRTVAGLRGLFAWLALHCQKARSRLITADPLTVVLYGDVGPMPVADKSRLLDGLRREAERYPRFRSGVRREHGLGALVDPQLNDTFLAALRAPERDEASQAYVDCVLEILRQGGVTPELGSVLVDLIHDTSRWPPIRYVALTAWLKHVASPSAALALLDAIRAERIDDPDDELAGALLSHLYPAHMGPEALFDYLHASKHPSLLGRYRWFWEYDVGQHAPEEHLAVLLDGLVSRPDLVSDDERAVKTMADELLARGVTTLGDEISDDRLFAWLGVGVDEYGRVSHREEARSIVSAWLGARPRRHKAMLKLCFESCKTVEQPRFCVYDRRRRLRGATSPEDIGLWHLEQVGESGSEAIARLHLEEAVRALLFQAGDAGLSLERLEDWADAHPERRSWIEPLLAWEIPDWRAEHAEANAARRRTSDDARRERTVNLQRHLNEVRDGKARADWMLDLANVWMGLYLDVHGTTEADRFKDYFDNGEEVREIAEEGFRNCPEREDLPTVDAIIDLALKRREHFIRRPCLLGMELRWRDGPSEIDVLPDETLRRMVAFRLTDGTGNTPEWVTYLVRRRPALVAGVLLPYASRMLKAGEEYVHGVYELEHGSDYRAVAVEVVPRLLESFRVRAKRGQLHHLEALLKAALRYVPEQLPALIETKLSRKGMDAAQRVYWLGAATLLDPAQYESALRQYVGRSEVRANDLGSFLGEHLGHTSRGEALPAGTLGRLIEHIAPHAEIAWRTGSFTATGAMERGDQIRALINRLGALATPEAEHEINRLLELPALHELKHLLEATRHESRQRQREKEFRFLDPAEVAQVLANQEPANAADLAALTREVLDDIGRELRQDNDDGFRMFWNVGDKKPTSPREENLCRDALLSRLRARLCALGIDVQPEGDYVGDKRADLRLSYRAQFELPIEIKRDSNSSLWRGLREQLIEQYAIASRANGFGIYLVLWFGRGNVAPAIDGGKKPRSPEELRARLEAQLDPLEQQRVFVRVLDVTWPGKRAQ